MEKNLKDMPAKQQSMPGLEVEPASLAEETSVGVIKVSHDVVANIVRITVLAVPGVVSVGSSGGLREEFVGLFNKRDASPGITVTENDKGMYEVTVKVILRYGVELAKVGEDIQNAVREQVTRMTSKKVTKVDVLIDGVRMAEKDETLGAVH